MRTRWPVSLQAAHVWYFNSSAPTQLRVDASLVGTRTVIINPISWHYLSSGDVKGSTSMVAHCYHCEFGRKVI